MKPIQNNIIFEGIKQLIEQTKQSIAVSINSTLTLLYWNIGKQINDEILKNSRADYGKEIVHSLSGQLTKEYGKGYTKTNILNMIKFNKVFNDIKIVHILSAKLTWTHFKTIIYIEDDLKRDFYIGMIKLDRWSTRTLKDRIDSQLYERTALSKKPDELIKYEKEEDENSPIGIILCANKQSEQIQLLELDKSNIHVAQYITVLPDKHILEKKLHQAIVNAKKRIENKS